MHPWWAESLQRQCESAGVPYLFKQWGEWTPLAPLDAQGRYDFSNGVCMTDDGNTYRPGDLDYPDGPLRGQAIRADFPHHHPTSMYRAGKKRAGRELYHDGRTFDQYPETVAHA
jgi:protein gp37